MITYSKLVINNLFTSTVIKEARSWFVVACHQISQLVNIKVINRQANTQIHHHMYIYLSEIH